MAENSDPGSSRRVTRSDTKRKEEEVLALSVPPTLLDTTTGTALTSVTQVTVVSKEKPMSAKSNANEEGSQVTRSSSSKKLLLQQIKEEEELIERKLALVRRRRELIAEGTDTASSSGSSVLPQKRVQDWVINSGTLAEEEEAVRVESKRSEASTTPPRRTPTKAQWAARTSKLTDLPKFEGSQTAWASFFATYKRTTELCGYSEEENLIRLNKCLEGKARETVECLLMHPGNVSKIIDTLRMKFGQPVRIIHELTNKISSFPCIAEGKFEEVVDLAIKVKNYCATVEVCELKGYMYNETLLHKIAMKLPPTLQLRWAEFTLEMDTVTLQTFSSWIGHIAKAACTITPLSTDTVRPTNDRKGTKGSFVNIHADQSPPTSSSAKASNTCVVCKGSCTSVDRCVRFADLSLEGRWAVVKEKQLCRMCLRQHKGFCKRAKQCSSEGCTYKHHTLLHGPRPQLQKKGEQKKEERQCNVHHNHKSDILFRMIPVRVYGQNVSVDTYAFMDDGSEITLMDESLANELQLEGPRKPLCLKWTNQISHHEEASKTVSIKLSGKSNELHSLHAIQTVKKLELPKQTLDMNSLIKKYPYLASTPAESYFDATPRILIGLDNARLSTVRKSHEGGRNQPVAGKTILGWTIYGYCGDERDASSTTHRYSLQVRKCECSCDETMHSAMKEYFALDSMGIDKSYQTLLSKEDERSLQLLSQQSRLIGKRYECGLLWKYDNVRLPDSKAMAINRWSCLERRMTKDKELAMTMETKIQEYLEKQYIRKLLPAELNEKHERVWYLPVFPITNPNKPGKFRIVWDAAAKAYGISLNSVLLKGPDQLSSLPSILMKFRQYKIGITGDIREMFHQVRIKKDDQHCQRFLWKPDTPSGEPSEYVMCVMTFGAACSPSTAQFIKNLNARRFENQYPAATKVILEQHYVDDMLTSVESEQEAITLAKEVKHVHSEGGFEIRNWLSNSKIVLNDLNGDESIEKSMNIGSSLPTEKVLGMYWCTQSDTFTYKLSPRYDKDLLNGKRAPTKREVLRMLMMVYDPLGLISHVLMYLKVLIQDIWRTNIGWDDTIDGSIFDKWKTWLKVLPSLEKIQIPRCYRTHTSKSSENMVQLHTFVDASESGFAAAAYLRFVEKGIIECSLVGAKTRVAPLKYISIPRAELQAGVLGVRLANNVIASLPIKVTERFFWTDSRDLLCWIQSDHRRYSPYVACRIGEILEKTNVSEWRWVPTKENVADDGTKWERLPDVSRTSRWFRGASFLYKPEAEWPKTQFNKETTTEELRPHLVLHCRMFKQIIEIKNFSTWTKLYRTMAFVFRAISCFRRGVKKNKKDSVNGIKKGNIPPLGKDEMIQAQNWLYKMAQTEAFPEEYSQLSEQQLIKASNSLHRLAPFLDENGVMKARGRIDAQRFTDLHVKHVVILPSQHYLTQLIVRHFHHSLIHRNHETAINQIRLQYYVPGLRKLYRKMRGNCQRCKNEACQPTPPMMGDLPEARLAAFNRPFSYVGVDYFGPMIVSVGRRSEKRWGVILTCLTIRAVHLELVNSLTTSSCIMALRCFMARRGVPHEIHSDNGTNFRGASRELVEALKNVDKNKLMEEIVSPKTAWKFIPPASPHMGGAWERLVRSVKENLAGKRLPRLPTEEVLRNALIEIENTINSRPLTHIPIDDDSAGVLTPNHFLLGSSNGLKPLTTLDDGAVAVRRGWELSQTMANIFWRHWMTAYLPTITRRTKWFSPAKPIDVDDIVVIVDPNAPRNSWPKGRVIAVTKSKDGQVRKATVQTALGIYERPAVKLAVLDVRVSNST